MNKHNIVEQLAKLDFMALDIGLYLDTHPSCEAGLSLYNRVTSETKKLRCAYEEAYGPIDSFSSQNPNVKKWMWIDEPFPWETDCM